jgi:hypothetical protein
MSTDEFNLYDALIENPDCLLALSLSTPPSQVGSFSAITIEFGESEVNARIHRPAGTADGQRLLATKDTIFAAILMQHLISKRGTDFASSLIENAQSFSERAVHKHITYEQDVRNEWNQTDQSPWADTSSFFRHLDASSEDMLIAKDKTEKAFAFLEQRGLVVDPAFAPGLMVLAGLFPMHFSIRTPMGERVYREIRINAPMWSLRILRGRKKDRLYTDIELDIRGIDLVRTVLTAMATKFLDSEEALRLRRGQPVIRRPGPPKLDGE